jgi:hypothetical protein
VSIAMRCQRDWARAVARTPLSAPAAKPTLPLEVRSGLRPTQLLQLSRTRYFFDFGQERMGGVSPPSRADPPSRPSSMRAAAPRAVLGWTSCARLTDTRAVAGACVRAGGRAGLPCR